ncbi:SpvB/TcaC N-terminal domain-containing protein [Agrilutibacter solisilvae]|uniref:Insecticide toxin TcdB middle/N-terminal domain-containing protein n=1 Tax=Agrilutibacter solisilvae TaxID=2763317 RepID=A0A974XX86_9GAMM|nr:SpvB/TcaC N-terminal domain-containing protein [Lysobacter solisilvae]QSX77501.1 hypothetical protein I8J32_012145 [Lysobacter solisilvae]
MESVLDGVQSWFSDAVAALLPESGAVGPFEPLKPSYKRPTKRPFPSFPSGDPVPGVEVGYLSGSAGVGGSGQATYSIPLEVPAGVRSMQPELSLSYSSGGADGPLGIGWSLQGASSIERCNKTLRTEGIVDGVTFSDDDALCLNGEKLVLVGKQANGDPEYRTESSPFDKIVHKLASNSFVLWSKDGRIATYSPLSAPRSKIVDPHTADRLAPWRVTVEPDAQVVAAWPLARLEDQFGNAVKYTYDPPVVTTIEGVGVGQEVRLKEISYSFEKSAVGNRQIKFWYDDRPEGSSNRFAFQNGVRSDLSKVLKRVEMWAPPQPGLGPVKQWQYELDFKTSQRSARPELVSVRKCDNLGNCGWKKEFTWQGQKDSLHLNATSSVIATAWGSLENALPVVWEQNPIVLDADGDGRSDIIFYDTNDLNSDKPAWKIALSSDWAFHTLRTGEHLLDIEDGANIASGRYRVADVNNDGRDDLIAGLDIKAGYDGAGNAGRFEYHCLTWNSVVSALVECMAPEKKDASNSDQTPRFLGEERYRWPLWNFADVDGDGRIDLVENNHVRKNIGITSNGDVAFNPTLHPMDLLDMDDAPNNQIAWPWKVYNRGAMAFDSNGDGRGELTLISPDGIEVDTLGSSDYSLSAGEPEARSFGLAADGTPIIQTIAGLGVSSIPYARRSIINSSNVDVSDARMGHSVMADVNGDGLKDRVIIWHEMKGDKLYVSGESPRSHAGNLGTHIQFNTGRGFTHAFRTKLQIRPIEDTLAHFADGTGAGDVGQMSTRWPAAVDVVDLNGDGRDDLLIKTGISWKWNPQADELGLLETPGNAIDPTVTDGKHFVLFAPTFLREPTSS